MTFTLKISGMVELKQDHHWFNPGNRKRKKRGIEVSVERKRENYRNFPLNVFK